MWRRFRKNIGAAHRSPSPESSIIERQLTNKGDDTLGPASATEDALEAPVAPEPKAADAPEALEEPEAIEALEVPRAPEEPAQKSLWDKAYTKLKAKKEKLVTEYESLLLQQHSQPTEQDAPRQRTRQEQLDDTVTRGLERMDEKRTTYTIFGEKLVVKNQAAQVSKFLLQLKSFVSDAIIWSEANGWQVPQRIATADGGLSAVAFSSDSHRLVFSSFETGQWQMWEIAADGSSTVLHEWRVPPSVKPVRGDEFVILTERTAHSSLAAENGHS